MKFIFGQTSKVLKPFYYISSALVLLHFGQSCKKEDTTDTPVVVEAKDHPTEFTMKTTNLPKGVSVDVSTKTLTVPPSMTSAGIIALFEQGKVSDPDGQASIKTVKIEGDKILISIQGKNGKTGKIDTTVIEWKLIVSDIVVAFPENLISTANVQAGDTQWMTDLLSKAISINDGTTVLPKVTVEGQEVVSGYYFPKPGTYPLVLSVTDSKGTVHQKSYEVVVLAKTIVTNDISSYTKRYKKRFNSINTTWQSRGQIEGVADRMKFGILQKVTSNILKTSGKNVAFFNLKEGNHHIEVINREILENNPELFYTSVSPMTDQNDPEMKQSLESVIANYNFVVAENNGWDRDVLYNLVNNSNHAYMFSAEFGPTGISPELLSNQGKGIVVFPTIITQENKLYNELGHSWTNIKYDPFNNNIDSPILGGLSLGGTSYATEGNAAIGAVLVNFAQRMELPMNKGSFNALLKNHPEWQEDIYYAYYPEGVEHRWVNAVWTDKVVAYLINFEKMIIGLGTFDLNPAILQLSETQPRVPLFANADKLNHNYIKLAEEKGIVKENGIFYVDYQLLTQQGLSVKDLSYHIIVIADPTSTNEYLFNLENWQVK